MSRTAVAILLILGMFASAASAATTADQLVALARAGLDDDILIALIQTDGSVFQLTADDILELHRQGLSSRVILAMLQTAVRPSADTLAGAEAPQAPGAYAPDAPVVAVPPPAVQPRPTGIQNVESPAAAEVLVPVAVPVIVPSHGRGPSSPPASPVYWGWGGQRRPDSWSDGSPPARTGPAREAPSHGGPTHDSKDQGKKER